MQQPVYSVRGDKVREFCKILFQKLFHEIEMMNDHVMVMIKIRHRLILNLCLFVPSSHQNDFRKKRIFFKRRSLPQQSSYHPENRVSVLLASES